MFHPDLHVLLLEFEQESDHKPLKVLLAILCLSGKLCATANLWQPTAVGQRELSTDCFFTIPLVQRVPLQRLLQTVNCEPNTLEEL